MLKSRRKLLFGAVALSTAWVGWNTVPAWGLADATAAEPSSGAGNAADFMRVSNLLVNHRLDGAIGARIALEAARIHPRWAEMNAAILGIAQARKAQIVEDFFDAIPEGAVRDYAHWVIFAWYTGCSSAQKDARVFTFEGALTYQTTADAVAIPSYGFSGPNLWHRAPAPLAAIPVF